MLLIYFKIAWRNLSRNKLFCIINVLGLALGLCACLVIYLVTSYELSFDTFHPGKDRIYRVSSKANDNNFSDGDVPAPIPAALRKEVSGIEMVTSYFPYNNPVVTIARTTTTTVKFDQNQNTVIIADPEYFAVFAYDWLAGSAAGSLAAPFSAT